MKNFFLFFVALCFSLHSSEDHWKAEEYYENSSCQRDIAAHLMQFISIKDGSAILDIGCGDGKITAAIAHQDPHGHVVGLDVSPAMIAFAQSTFLSSQYPNLTFTLKDAQDIDYQGEFDLIVSFTALQWIQDHRLFLQGAYQSLKPSGALAITMPMGLPYLLQEAVDEVIAKPEWETYFRDFSTGWNFVDEETYADLLESAHFTSTRVAVIPQKDGFPSREVFKNFISQWFPYLRPLPQELKEVFLTQVLDLFLSKESLLPNGGVPFKIRCLEVVAVKN